MGWSCARAAAETLDKCSEACRKSSGSSNVWKDGDSKYFYEPSRTEHHDGAITGAVYLFLDDKPDGGKCRKVGSFKIDGGGRFVRSAGGLSRLARQG